MNSVQFSLGVAVAAWMIGAQQSPAMADQPTPEAPVGSSALCASAAAREEQARHIPDALLQALALAESGRRDDSGRRLVAWPWTVMAEGEGHFHPSKEAAVAAVRKLQKQGVRNIDVGCMQVNLIYHADAFGSLEDALDPDRNVAYGAQFLVSLKRETGSWFSAIKRYHSASPEHHLPYRMRVFSIWRNAKRQLAAEARQPSLPITSTTEMMSTTVSHRTVDLAELPAMTSRQPREARWQDAFRQTEEALARWRQWEAARPVAPRTGPRIVSPHAPKAMEILSQAVKR